MSDEKLIDEIAAIPSIDGNSLKFITWKIGEGWWEQKQDSISEFGDLGVQTTYSMGASITVGTIGNGTIGSPTNSSGGYFYTANHGVVSTGTTVLKNGAVVGVVDAVQFNSKVDASRVNVISYGNSVSSNLNSYKASTPGTGGQVKAHTAYSGTITGMVSYPSINVISPSGNNMIDMIGVNMATQAGDSGACLTVNGLYGLDAVGIVSFGGTAATGAITICSKLTNFTI
jgi:hypothetical protein